jgi:hypothetical protein
MIPLKWTRSGIGPVIHNGLLFSFIFSWIQQALLSTELKLVCLNGSYRVHLPFLERILQQSHVPRFRIQQVVLFEASSLPLISWSNTICILIIYALLRLLRLCVGPITMRAQRTYPFTSGGVCPYACFFEACLLCHIAKSSWLPAPVYCGHHWSAGASSLSGVYSC